MKRGHVTDNLLNEYLVVVTVEVMQSGFDQITQERFVVLHLALLSTTDIEVGATAVVVRSGCDLAALVRIKSRERNRSQKSGSET